MADENSVYNITEHDSTRTYSKDDIVVVFERFASNSVPNSVPKSAKYYYSTSNNNSGVDSSSWPYCVEVTANRSPPYASHARPSRCSYHPVQPLPVVRSAAWTSPVTPPAPASISLLRFRKREKTSNDLRKTTKRRLAEDF